jgi:hypothetical protein
MPRVRWDGVPHDAPSRTPRGLPVRPNVRYPAVQPPTNLRHAARCERSELSRGEHSRLLIDDDDLEGLVDDSLAVQNLMMHDGNDESTCWRWTTCFAVIVVCALLTLPLAFRASRRCPDSLLLLLSWISPRHGIDRLGSLICPDELAHTGHQ